MSGAPLRTGDLLTSGPVSGSAGGRFGVFPEPARNGRDPLGVPDGTEQVFMEDGDIMCVTASASGPEGVQSSLGEVVGMMHPAV
ncbi:hypothetical protein Aros01_03400 [Streptosporangium roseum]